jgi:dipeptidyl-peptidase-3
MQTLLSQEDFMQLAIDKSARRLTVSIDRSRIRTHGVKAISELLLHLHIYRCTADVEAAGRYFGALTRVEGDWLEIRDVVLERIREEPSRIFVQANTYVNASGRVDVKEYEATVEGVVQSWAERDI